MGRRNLQIDVLRGVAILAVLCVHTIIFRNASAWERPLLAAGWAGVDLFFVLSGFLISGLLFSEYQENGKIGVKRFLARRAMKIYPPLYLLIVGTLIYRLVAGYGNGSAYTPFLRDVFFIQSYLPGTFEQFWSLSVEEHFYILLPLVLLGMIRWGGEAPFRKIPQSFLAVAVFCLSARIMNSLLLPYSAYTHHFPTHLRMDTLMFGVLLSYWARFHAVAFKGLARRYYYHLWISSAVLISPCFLFAVDNPLLYTVGFISLYVGFGCLLVALLHTALPVEGVFSLPSKTLAGLGRHSYSIYLWHFVLIYLMQHFKIFEMRFRLGWYFAVCIGVGIALSKLIEMPALMLREKLLPVERKPQGTAIAPAVPVSLA